MREPCVLVCVSILVRCDFDKRALHIYVCVCRNDVYENTSAASVVVLYYNWRGRVAVGLQLMQCRCCAEFFGN